MYKSLSLFKSQYIVSYYYDLKVTNFYTLRSNKKSREKIVHLKGI